MSHLLGVRTAPLTLSAFAKTIKTLVLSMLLSDTPTIGWHEGS